MRDPLEHRMEIMAPDDFKADDFKIIVHHAERINPKKHRTARRKRPDWSSHPDVHLRNGRRVLIGHALKNEHGKPIYRKPSGISPKNPQKGDLEEAQIKGALHKARMISKGKGRNGKQFIGKMERLILKEILAGKEAV